MAASMTVGQRIRLLRIALDLSQRRFGLLLGKTAETIAAYESGETSPRLEDMAKLHQLRINAGPFVLGKSTEMFEDDYGDVRREVMRIVNAAEKRLKRS
ncbi:MAG: helix-turn-helix domain-containing protein [Chitinivibrionales bacterium]|nr:helix-turn-helix domain-containing protein [Chitinivibrionales bacterium]